MNELKLLVYGVPVPQGSMRAFNIPGGKFPVVTSDNKKTKPWKQEIAGAADDAMQKAKLTVFAGVPVRVAVDFYFDRPKSTKKAIVAKVTKPDLDKLVRAVLDALTGTVFKDDAQVARISVSKAFDQRPRAEISVYVYEHHEWDY